MKTDKLTSHLPAAASSTPPAREKQVGKSEDSATSRQVDTLAGALDKVLSLDPASPGGSRNASPGRGQSIQIAVAFKSPRPAAVSAVPPAYEPAAGLEGHKYDEAKQLLHTEKGTYLLGATVGEGSFGKVLQGVNPLGHPVVVKVVDMTQDLNAATTDAARAAVVKKHRLEFNAMRKAHGRYQPLELVQVGHTLFISLPPLRMHMAHPGLQAKMSPRLRPAVARCMLHDIGADLARVHGHGWLHRDIKLENFMSNAAGEVILIDFGEALEIGKNNELLSHSPDCNSALFAPETFLHFEESFDAEDPALHGERKDSRASEMFSLGLCWAVMATGIHEDAIPFLSNPQVHEAWGAAHASLPIDQATGCIDRAALAELAGAADTSYEAKRLFKFVGTMCDADAATAAFVALRVMHPNADLRPTAAETRNFCAAHMADASDGRAVLRARLPSEDRVHEQSEALLKRHEDMVRARAARS